ncbi:hypothetical protein [Pseudoalteromonas sp. Of7M-16]|uniref:hypothetical protein n=1 Tax=Pseudoalteromonas sp. Of7M-16 TaxID=2917756 RepID=UPI001EF4992E|nr:hypothetical protein [Pseudoalteromonas sp. Of7M-16]MCG7551566.1 hypothetical protein [Pseudoalteromonas sp. Of7M-16]
MRCPFERASRRIIRRLANATTTVKNKKIRVLVQNVIESEDLEFGGFVENQELTLIALQNEISNVEPHELLSVTKDSGELLTVRVMRPPQSKDDGLSVLSLTLSLGNGNESKPVIQY